MYQNILKTTKKQQQQQHREYITADTHGVFVAPCASEMKSKRHRVLDV